jgi:hypothetical protein
MSPFAHARDEEARWKESQRERARERESARARDEQHSLRVSDARSQLHQQLIDNWQLHQQLKVAVASAVDRPRLSMSASDAENSSLESLQSLVRRSNSKKGELRGEAGRERKVCLGGGGEAGRERGEREGRGRSQRSHSREAARRSSRSHAADSFSRAHDFAEVDTRTHAPTTRTHAPTLSSPEVFQRRAHG